MSQTAALPLEPVPRRRPGPGETGRGPHLDWLLLPIILLSLALYLYALEAKSLWYDELATLTCSGWGGTWADVIRRSLTIPATPKPPLYFFVTSLFVLLGDRVWLLRLPAAVFGALTVPLLYVLVRRLVDRQTGLLAALLLALAPFYVRYGQEARMYTMLTFLSLLCLYLFCRAIDSTRWRWWLALALAGAAGLYVHLFALLPLGVIGLYGLVLWLWPATRARLPFRRRQMLAVPILVLLFFAPMIPAFVRGLVQAEGLGGTAAPDWTASMLVDALRLWSGGGNTGLVVYGLLLVLAAAVLAARRPALLLAALAWLLLPVLLVLVLPFGQAARIRYFTFGLPIYLALVAYGLRLALGWVAARARPRQAAWAGLGLAVTIGLALLFALNAPGLAAYYAETKQNWRDVSRHVYERAQPGDIVYVRHIYHKTGFLFYAGQWPEHPGVWSPDNVRLLPDDTASAFRLSDQAEYWLIVPGRESFLPGGSLDEQIQPYHRLSDALVFSVENAPREAEIIGPTSYRPVIAVQVQTPARPTVRFWADQQRLASGGCTWLRWQVDKVQEVYVAGQGVVGSGARQVCPCATTSYELLTIHSDGSRSQHTVEIVVNP